MGDDNKRRKVRPQAAFGRVWHAKCAGGSP